MLSLHEYVRKYDPFPSGPHSFAKGSSIAGAFPTLIQLLTFVFSLAFVFPTSFVVGIQNVR